MKWLSWQIILAAVLLALSAVAYGFHYAIFRDSHHIFIFLVGDVAFVFLEVLLVSFIIHRILERRDRRARLDKLNMVIGAFYSEVGTRLLEMLSTLDADTKVLQERLAEEEGTSEREFEDVVRWLDEHRYRVDAERTDWEGLRDFLVEKRSFLLRLLENPTVLEHESFSDVLWAVFHLTEELEARDDLSALPSSDIRHLCGDVERVYGRLAREWTAHMQHLKQSYPYLFSLALRTNPFDRCASPIVLQ